MLAGIEIYADAAEISDIRRLKSDSTIQGFTTNPTLMRQSGISDYGTFARQALSEAGNKPVSLEVVADDCEKMVAQGQVLDSLGSNVVVKVPITTSTGQSCVPVVRRLLDDGIRVNVTAVTTLNQVQEIQRNLDVSDPVIVSIFAGRIADTGLDPTPTVMRAVEVMAPMENTRVLWASPREILNAVQARDAQCDIITLTPALIKKLELFGKDLESVSLDTVKMFVNDAQSADLEIR